MWKKYSPAKRTQILADCNKNEYQNTLSTSKNNTILTASNDSIVGKEENYSDNTMSGKDAVEKNVAIVNTPPSDPISNSINITAITTTTVSDADYQFNEPLYACSNNTSHNNVKILNKDQTESMTFFFNTNENTVSNNGDETSNKTHVGYSENTGFNCNKLPFNITISVNVNSEKLNNSDNSNKQIVKNVDNNTSANHLTSGHSSMSNSNRKIYNGCCEPENLGNENYHRHPEYKHNKSNHHYDRYSQHTHYKDYNRVKTDKGHSQRYYRESNTKLYDSGNRNNQNPSSSTKYEENINNNDYQNKDCCTPENIRYDHRYHQYDRKRGYNNSRADKNYRESWRHNHYRQSNNNQNPSNDILPVISESSHVKNVTNAEELHQNETNIRDETLNMDKNRHQVISEQFNEPHQYIPDENMSINVDPMLSYTVVNAQYKEHVITEIPIKKGNIKCLETPKPDAMKNGQSEIQVPAVDTQFKPSKRGRRLRIVRQCVNDMVQTVATIVHSVESGEESVTKNDDVDEILMLYRDISKANIGNYYKKSSSSINTSTSKEKMPKKISKKDHRRNKKLHCKRQQSINKLFDHLRDISQNLTRTSECSVIELDDTQNTVIEAKPNNAQDSLIIIPDDDVQSSTPKRAKSLHHSTPMKMEDEHILAQSSNNMPSFESNVTRQINRDSYLTIDLTAESNITKTEPTVIDLENTVDNDVTVVSPSNASSMSGDSEITILRQPISRKLRKYTNGIANLTALEKGKLLELITQTIFNGCKVPDNIPCSITNVQKSLPRAPETAEDTYIKDVILGRKASRNSVGSNIYHPDRQTVRTGPRMVVIDGSNVAMQHGRGRHFSVRGLQICIDYFLRKGHVVKAFVPRFRCKHGMSSDARLLDSLERSGHVIYTPSREIKGRTVTPYDDRYILQCAAEFDGVVISGDNYRDLIDENPRWRFVIENRLLPFTWVQDMIMFPKDPLGRYGPTLEQFLQH